ncbi:aminoacyl-histidine dipeptidase [Reticulomyxa filosa]|uniref:Aminoacyl-histidine dipeptidase n=1 Tax=Reticulomyxa filosa TaxID=46433 RepID=X6PB31_RETFI|nr:aminoacyl-histidine dipeptidase [Reticulomyxa filosa]|eukprot:ETO34847.1 aminoacyl-histidine dipeptidase [Reticulomyxa filosa]
MKTSRLAPSLPMNFMGKTVKLQPAYEKLLSELPEPKLLWKHFMTCLQTPRLVYIYLIFDLIEQISPLKYVCIVYICAAIAETAKIIGVEYTQDKIGNIVLRKSATTGFEKSSISFGVPPSPTFAKKKKKKKNKKSKVSMQCHMDMVCTKTDDVKHDFENDGIKAQIVDEKWLKAEGTTLGADDGIGIAAGLAIMEDAVLEKIGHGTLELLITVDEETSMAGAIDLAEHPFLQSVQMINLDSEETDKICIGCAGGFSKTINFNQLAFESIDKNEFVGLQVVISRANAIICIARLLNELLFGPTVFDVRIYECIGGNAMNAIPRKCSCTLVVKKTEVSKVTQVIQEFWNSNLLPEFKDIEKNMALNIEDKVTFPEKYVYVYMYIYVSNSFFFFFVNGFDLSLFNNQQQQQQQSAKVVDKNGSESIVTMMMLLPHGVLRMSPTVPNVVQTSIAFSLLKWNHQAGQVQLLLFGRSFSMAEMIETNKKLDAIVRINNFAKAKNDTCLCVGSPMTDTFPGFLLALFFFVCLFGFFLILMI